MAKKSRSKKRARKSAAAKPAVSKGDALSADEKALVVKVLDHAINARLPFDAQAVSGVLRKLRVKK